MTTDKDYPDIPALQPRRVPTRFARKLEPEIRRRLGLDREPINWGDFTIAAVVVSLLVYLVIKFVVLA